MADAIVEAMVKDSGVKGPELYGDGKTRRTKSKSKKSLPKPKKPPLSAFSNDDEEKQQSVKSSSRKRAGCTIKEFEAMLDQLSHKLKPKREEALSTIVQTLSNKELGGDYVDHKFVTLLYLFTCRFRKGSGQEIELASQAIGLLAISIQDEDSAREVYQESLPVLSQAILKSCSNGYDSVFDALALVTLFGSENSDETERSMQIIWEFLKPDSGSANNNAGRLSGPAVSASISAWSLLLSTIDGWRLSQKSWLGAVSYLSGLLEEEDDSVYAAAGEALALIFEIGCLEKFMTDADGSRKNSLEQELMDTITEQVRVCSITEQEKSVWNPDLDVLKFFEDGSKCLQTSAKIGGDRLNLSTWGQRLQLNFMRSFIGKDGIGKQMKENKNLMHSPTREEVKHSFFDRRILIVKKEDFSLLPHISCRDKKVERRMNMSPCSVLSKGRTQLLNKKRMISMEPAMAYHLADE